MKIYAPTGREVQYNGTHGNMSVAVLSISLAAVAAGTTVVMGEFDNAIEVVDYKLTHDALGAGVTLDAGFAYFDDTPDAADAIASGLDAAAAGLKRQATKTVGSDTQAQLTVTPQGATATGNVELVVFYRNNG